MTGQVGQDTTGGAEEPRDEAAPGDFGNAGVGAASALEKMKSQHERRHKRLHGGPWSERDDDAQRER